MSLLAVWPPVCQKAHANPRPLLRSLTLEHQKLRSERRWPCLMNHVLLHIMVRAGCMHMAGRCQKQHDSLVSVLLEKLGSWHS